MAGSMLGDPELTGWAERHKAVIDRFGRFPYRNAVLGRASTPEEIEFLGQPGSSFCRTGSRAAYQRMSRLT